MIRLMFARPNANLRGLQCSRRSALAVMAITGVTLLSACSDSGLDTDAGPSDGGGSTGGPGPAGVAEITDAAVLLATLTQTREVLAACEAVAENSTRRLRRICTVIEDQRDVLVRLLDAGGLNTDDQATATVVPDDEAAATGGPDAAEATAEMTVAALLAQQSSGAGMVDTLVTVSPTNLPTLMALHGQRAAAAQILGETLTWPTVQGPLDAGAITVLAGLRQAVYGFEVLVSRSSEKEREKYSKALASLREASRTVTELAGAAAPAAPLGYGLPNEVGTEDERRQLATDLLSALPQAVIAGSAARAGDEDAIGGTVRLMSLAVRLGASFAVPAAPFPGLTVPHDPTPTSR